MIAKRIASLILCFCLILSLVPFSANAYSVNHYITCISSEESHPFILPIAEIDGELYIAASDVPRISGFEHRGDSFCCGDREISLTLLNGEEDVLVSLQEAVEKLEVKITPIQDGIFCQSIGATKARAMQLAKSVIVDDPYRYRVGSSNNRSIKQGVVISLIYDSLSLGNTIDMVIGEYGRSVNRSVLLDILSEDHDEAVGFLSEGCEIFDEFAKLSSLYEEKDILNDPFLLIGYIYDKATDPISEITKDNVFSIQGLGVKDLLDIYTEFESVSYISESRANMFRFTIGSDKIGGPGSSIHQKAAMFPVSYWSMYLPGCIEDVLAQYAAMFDSEEYSTIWKHFVKQAIAQTISGKIEDSIGKIDDSIKDSIKNYLKDMVGANAKSVNVKNIHAGNANTGSSNTGSSNTGSSNTGSSIAGSVNNLYERIDLTKMVFENLYQFWTHDDYHELMKVNQKMMVLSEIQEMARRLYTAYASFSNNEINIKYCALLYLRCYRVFCDYAQEICKDLNNSACISSINAAMADLYALPDEYLLESAPYSLPDLQPLLSTTETEPTEEPVETAYSEPTESATEPTEPTEKTPEYVQWGEFQVMVNESAGELIVRSGPSTAYPEVKRIPGGYYVVIYEVATTDGVEWGKCGDGWICLDYTTRTSEPKEYDRAVLDSYFGHWGDRIGMRCMMSVYPTDGGYITFELSWASGASSTTNWELRAEYDEATQRFKYEHGRCYTLNTTEYGTDVIEHYQDGSGYFYIDAGYMYWVDEKENQGANCCFEKTSELFP